MLTQQVQESFCRPMLNMPRRITETGQVFESRDIEDPPERLPGYADEQVGSGELFQNDQGFEWGMEMLQDLAADNQFR